MNTDLDDRWPDRIGHWMQTSTGGRFFPLDPRPEDFTIGDLANGMALDCRYGGQGRIDRYYSVAEHCRLMAGYSWRTMLRSPRLALAVLLHDAAEGFLNDLPRAVKHAVGIGYNALEYRLQNVIWAKYGLTSTAKWGAEYIKTLDRRIVPLEKAVLHPKATAWAFDQFEPLEGVEIICLDPPEAKREFLLFYDFLCREAGIPAEEWEI